MKFYGENENGRFLLPEAVSAEIDSEYGVPADSLTVRFSGVSTPGLYRIDACTDDGELIFRGIVDEQETTETVSGVTSAVYARSPAALPLDNECEPGEYTDPSLDVIAKRHLDRFGIVCSEHPTAASGKMNVARGQSHWTAVKSFCSLFLGTEPRVNSVGEFRSNCFTGGEPIIFGGSGIGFTSVKSKVNRYCRISKIYVGTSGDTIVIEDADAQNRGIIRERRLSLTDSRTGTLFDADDMISRSKLNAQTVELICPCFIGDIVGRTAVVEYGSFYGRKMYVIKTRYTANGSDERTTVTLSENIPDVRPSSVTAGITDYDRIPGEDQQIYM